MKKPFVIQAIFPDGEVEVFECTSEEFILDQAENAGIDLPHSCRNGGCLRCCAKKTEGNIIMEEQYVLEEGDIKNGFFLPCCSKASSDLTFLVDQEIELDI